MHSKTKTNTERPTNNGEYFKQKTNNNGTTALELSAAQATRGGGGGLNALDFVVVKTQNCLARMEASELMQCIIMEINQFTLTYYHDKKKRAYDTDTQSERKSQVQLR